MDASIVRARQQIVQNEPICPQIAKRSGALRFCALRRAARPKGKIRPVQNFSWLAINANRIVQNEPTSPGGAT
jgi:hypothetical protein